jgi:hypothetical protein
MPASSNLRDLERHAEDFRLRRGFTYTVLGAEGDVIGCVYIYPSDEDGVDAQVRSWVRADRGDEDLPLFEALSAWLQADWPFRIVHYPGRGRE